MSSRSSGFTPIPSFSADGRPCGVGRRRSPCRGDRRRDARRHEWVTPARDWARLVRRWRPPGSRAPAGARSCCRGRTARCASPWASAIPRRRTRPTLRDAGAAFARAASGHARIARRGPVGHRCRAAGRRGALLARYRYDVLRSCTNGDPIAGADRRHRRRSPRVERSRVGRPPSRVPRCSPGTSPTRPTAT